jgi:AraC-like DNA-binding protein
MHGVKLDLKDIKKLLIDFHTVTGIRVAFVSYDLGHLIEVPEEKSDFCTLLRKDPLAEHKCKECDSAAFKIAAQTGSLYTYTCHAGLTEAVSPILHEGKLLGYLMMGQTLNTVPDNEMWEKLHVICSNYKVDLDSLEQAFYRINSIDSNKLQAAANIMDISSKYIHLEKLAKLKEPQLVEKIKGFVDSNLGNAVTINDLSKNLKLSSSYLSHIMNDKFNLSFTEYLTAKRLEKAKQLLESSSLKVHEIACTVGFQDQNYFARIFKKHTGTSSIEYRKTNKQ